MDEDSLFSETEEELFNKIKKVYNSINKNLNEAGIKDDSISAFSIDDTISLSDDGLSQVSDISSVASFKFSSVKKKKNEFRSPQLDKKKHRKSKIPVFDLQRKNRQNSMLNSNSRNSNIAPKRNQLNNNMKASPNKAEQKFTENKNQKQTFQNNRINIYSYQEPIKPQNFLIPDLSVYSRVCVCLLEGRDFPLPSSGRGERSTYAVIQLHPDILPIQSPISFNKTKKAIYNGGFDINCSGFDFSSVTPIVSVYDYISEKERELIGVAFIELHLAKQFNDEMCIFMLDEWLDIFALNNRVKTGKVKITLIFHTDEKDVSNFIKKKSNLQPNIKPKHVSSESDDEDKLIIKNEIIIDNDEDDADIDFIADDDESIRKANEKLKNEKMKRNKSKKEAKFESLGIQAEPEFQNNFMRDFQNFSLNSSSSTPVKDKNPFNFNVDHNKNDKSNQSNKRNSNENPIKRKNQTNNNNNFYGNNKEEDRNLFSDDDNENENNFSDEDSDNNKFDFTFDPSFEKNEIESNKNNIKIHYNDESIIETDSLIPQKVPLSKSSENATKLDDKQLKFIDESMLGTIGSIISNDEFNEKSSSFEEENENFNDEKENENFNDEKENKNYNDEKENENYNDEKENENYNDEKENKNYNDEKENENYNDEKEKPTKRYTSYSDYHFMDEMK